MYKFIWAIYHRVDRWRIKKLNMQVFRLKKENIKLNEKISTYHRQEQHLPYPISEDVWVTKSLIDFTGTPRRRNIV